MKFIERHCRSRDLDAELVYRLKTVNAQLLIEFRRFDEAADLYLGQGMIQRQLDIARLEHSLPQDALWMQSRHFVTRTTKLHTREQDPAFSMLCGVRCHSVVFPAQIRSALQSRSYLHYVKNFIAHMTMNWRLVK